MASRERLKARHQQIVIKFSTESATGYIEMIKGTLGFVESATALAQRGIGKIGPNALHTGDEIKVKFLPGRDGSSLGFLTTVIMPDGRVIQISAGSPND